MPDIQLSSGRTIELRRFLTRRTRWSELDPARERWELWLALDGGGDRKFIVRSRSMPARVGHVLDLLHVGDEPVGLYNRSTGESVNFTRADPMPLFRPVDVLPVFIGFFGFPMLAALNRVLTAVALALLMVLYYPTAILARLARRYCLQRSVDTAIKRIPRRRESPAHKRR